MPKLQVQTSKRQKEPVIPDLKPSLPRAPKLIRKKPKERDMSLRLGRDIPAYDPAVDK